jgi:hypothetical protein
MFCISVDSTGWALPELHRRLHVHKDEFQCVRCRNTPVPNLQTLYVPVADTRLFRVPVAQQPRIPSALHQ